MMLASLTVTLSPLAHPDCADVVKTCDNLIDKKNQLIELETDHSAELTKRLQSMTDAYNSMQNRQDLFLVGGVGAGALITVLLMRK